MQVLGLGAARAHLAKRGRPLDLCHSGRALVRGLDGRALAQAAGAGCLLECSMPRRLHPPAPFHAGCPQVPFESGARQTREFCGRYKTLTLGGEQQWRVGLCVAHWYFHQGFNLLSFSFTQSREEEYMGIAQQSRAIFTTRSGRGIRRRVQIATTFIC